MGHGAMQTVKLPIVQSYDRQAESEMWKACYSSADLKRKQQSTGTVVDGFTRLNKICHLSNLGNSRIAKRTSTNLGRSHCLPHVCTKMMFSKFGSIAWEHDEHRCDITFKGGIAVWSIPYIFPTAGVFVVAHHSRSLKPPTRHCDCLYSENSWSYPWNDNRHLHVSWNDANKHGGCLLMMVYPYKVVSPQGCERWFITPMK